MEEIEFVATFPAVVLLDHRGAKVKRYVGGRHAEQDFLIMFSDKDLAERYYEGVGRPPWMALGVIQTPQDLIEFLKTAENLGCQHIGFDPTKENVPQRVYALERVSRSVKKAFPES
jgi:hypothetical protein